MVLMEENVDKPSQTLTADRDPEGLSHIIENSHILEASHVREVSGFKNTNSGCKNFSLAV